MQLTTFTADGMRCEGCTKRIRTLSQQRHVVHKAEVPFAGGGDAVVALPYL